MLKGLSRLKLAQEKTEQAIRNTNNLINSMGFYANGLATVINTLHMQLDNIRNVPTHTYIKYHNIKDLYENWLKTAEKIQENCKSTCKNFPVCSTTTAMGITTAFGLYSGKTSLFALNSSTLAKHSLTRLGVGSLTAGGSSIVTGTMLAIIHPIGLTIASVLLLGSGLFCRNSMLEKDHLYTILALICERDEKRCQCAIIDLSKHINTIREETDILLNFSNEIQHWGLDYSRMSKQQKHQLGCVVNKVESSTKLLSNPVYSLLPPVTPEYCQKFLTTQNAPNYIKTAEYQQQLLTLANLFYKITLDENDKTLLIKFLKNNKTFLSAEIDWEHLDMEIMNLTDELLAFTYSHPKP